MKKTKLLAIVLTLAIILTQFTALSTVMASATGSYSALSGRSDFDFGVNIHEILNYAAYTETYDAIIDSKSLGANIIRVGRSNDSGYFNDVISVADNYGMDVMAVDSYFKTFVRNGTDYANIIDYNNVDVSAITTYYTDLATQYAGKIKYYQLGNELDNLYKKDSSGKLASSFNDVKGLAQAIYAATNAIHTADPSAKVVVNFSWTHYGFIEAIKNVKIDSTTGLYSASGTETATWDLIGMDFYKATSSSDSYTDVFNALDSYTEDIIVCEANVKATEWDESDHDVITYNGDASWLGDFITAAYNNSKVKGFIPYELYDQPARTGHGETFNAEGFFGLIDRNGVKKDTYNVVQTLFGGTDVTRTAPTEVPAVDTMGGVLQNVYPNLHTDTMQTKLQRGNDATFLTIEDLSSTAFDQMKTIEFDVFIEDKDAFDAVVKNNSLTLKAILTDANNGVREARNLSAGLIYQSGWNHISLTRAQFSQGSGKYWEYGIKKFTFGFGGATAEQYSALSGMNIAVANLCVTDIAAYETKSNVGDKISTQPNMTPTTLTFGGTNSNGSACTNFTGIARQNITFTPVVLTGAEYIEFDIYVADYEAYRAAMTNASAQFRIMFTTRAAGAGWDRRKGYNITDMITKRGWNHIVLRCADYAAGDITKALNAGGSDSATATTGTNTVAHVFFGGGLQRVYFAYYTANTAAANPIAGNTFTVSNIIATKKTTPPYTYADVISTLTTEGRTHAVGAQYNYVGDNFKVTGLDAKDFSEAKYIEFDFFVPNYETLKADMDAKSIQNLALRLSSNASNPDSNQATLTFFNDKITKSGWNHVVLKKSDFATSSMDWTNVKSYKVYANGSDTKVACAQSGQELTIANIQATGVARPAKNNVASLERTVVLDGIKRIVLGANFTTKLEDTSIGTKDISKADYIEFDLYVENREALLNAITAANANRTLNLRISSSTTSDKSYQSKTVALNSYILTDGWNHIQVPLSAFVKGSTSGNIDLTAVSSYNFFFNGNGSDVNAAQGQAFAVANISATADFSAPSIYATDKTDLVCEVVDDNFDGDGIYQKEFIDAVDISEDKMVEFDFYADESAFGDLTLALVDGNGNTGMYTVACSNSGWNHYYIKIADFVCDEGVLDTTAIVSVAFVGNANANCVFANLYATDYVDGDANRDGAVDLLDLVCAKKYLAGPDGFDKSSVNLCAIDLSGSDYEVLAADIAELVSILLAD